MPSIKDQCKKAVEEYTGVKVKAIEVVRDPQVAGCVAMKCTMEKKINGEQDLYFLKTHSDPITSETLEEAEFESWPPKSGQLKFF